MKKNSTSQPNERIIPTNLQINKDLIPTSYKCDICNKTLKESILLQEAHKKRCEDLKKLFECKTCNLPIHGKIMLEVHQYEKHYENPNLKQQIIGEDTQVICRVCLKHFTHEVDLQAHILRVHCQVGKNKNNSNLNSNNENKQDVGISSDNTSDTKKSDHQEKSYKCEFCDRFFKQKYHFEVHQKVHKERMEQNRKNISTSGSTENQLRDFRSTSANNRDDEIQEIVVVENQNISEVELPPYPTEDEEKLGINEKSKKNQFVNNTGKTNDVWAFKCDLCNKYFKSGIFLTAHNKIVHHNNIPNTNVANIKIDHKCKFRGCGKSFPQAFNLKMHISKAHPPPLAKISNNDRNTANKRFVMNLKDNLNLTVNNPTNKIIKNLTENLRFAKKDVVDKRFSNLTLSKKLNNHLNVTVNNPTRKTIKNLTETPRISSSIVQQQPIKSAHQRHENFGIRKNHSQPLLNGQSKKTKVEISINGNRNNVNWLKICKPSKTITLSDIKKLLWKQPKMYGLSSGVRYRYRVKTTEDGQVGFEDVDSDYSILPIFQEKIVLQCWSQ